MIPIEIKYKDPAWQKSSIRAWYKVLQTWILASILTLEHWKEILWWCCKGKLGSDWGRVAHYMFTLCQQLITRHGPNSHHFQPQILSVAYSYDNRLQLKRNVSDLFAQVALSAILPNHWTYLQTRIRGFYRPSKIVLRNARCEVSMTCCDQRQMSQCCKTQEDFQASSIDAKWLLGSCSEMFSLCLVLCTGSKGWERLGSYSCGKCFPYYQATWGWGVALHACWLLWLAWLFSDRCQDIV